MEKETFSNSQIIHAVEQWLEYGEKTYIMKDENPYDIGHHGDFSGMGWAARVLRYHLEELKENKNVSA